MISVRARWAVVATVAAVAAAAALAWSVRDGGTDGAERTVAIDSVVVEDRLLRVRFIAGADGCGTPAGVAVEETATTVRLTARVRYETSGGRSVCPLAGRRITEQVTLSAPLGERAVIDGRSDTRVEVIKAASGDGA